MESSKTYLVTGGSGYLGRALIKRLYERCSYNIRVVARNEGELIKLQDEFPLLTIITGDISDPFIVEKACAGVGGIFHLAAFKHVGLAEKNTRECIESNVTGTMNLLEYTRKNNVDFIIGISSDKAARVSGVYGATKMLQERLFQEYQDIRPETKYRTVRYGNVLYSTGSVLCKWRDKLKRGEPVIVTDLRATRFYWTVDEAIDLIFDALENAETAAPQSVPMKAICIEDLLNAMGDKYLPEGAELDADIIGLQPGENLHEVITADGQDSSLAERYTYDEIMKLI